MERLRRIMNGDFGTARPPAGGAAVVAPPVIPPPPMITAMPPVPHGDPGYYPELYGHPAGSQPAYHPAEVSPPAYGGYATDQDTLAMKSILTKMYAAEGGESPRPDPPRSERLTETAEALRKSPEPRPAARKPWRVASRDKLFDVVHPSGDALIRGLSLKETAVSLAKLMNRGLYLNHESIRRVLDLDESYGTKRREAVGFQRQVRRLLDEGDNRAAKILEKNYRKAREEALAVKTKLVRLAEAV